MILKPINVAITDDHALFRKLLVDFLSEKKNLSINLETGDAFELLSKLKKVPVDIVLLDLFMPGMNGIDTVTILRNEFPDIKIIIVSLCTDLKIISGLLDLGIYAYLSKADEPANLLQAIVAASENRIYRNKLFTEALYIDKEQKINRQLKSPAYILTEREKKIVQLLWEEKSNQEIASAVYLSVSSVEKLKQELKERLEVKSIIGLFKHALKNGIISIQTTLAMQ
ncbi:hypothetical protein A3860_05000 [Niastella vici]|uniref:DNA-binding response regulator n=1 Tax=Niastella vici TaxID=1703345 RepID=A0A1V9FRY0_9BACT|nr:response regulator transcription factor [Niastella vici]OQP61078.1 hypothetical protein A3860_05000 [Niastella vici]